MSSPTSDQSRDALPGWAEGLTQLYYSGTTSLFVLHGNTLDVVRSTAGGEGSSRPPDVEEIEWWQGAAGTPLALALGPNGLDG